MRSTLAPILNDHGVSLVVVVRSVCVRVCVWKKRVWGEQRARASITQQSCRLNAAKTHHFNHTLALKKKVPAKAHLVIAPAHADAVADLLAKKAQELNAAALVVASSGKSRVQELWTGSVAQRLTRRSHVSGG